MSKLVRDLNRIDEAMGSGEKSFKIRNSSYLCYQRVFIHLEN